MSDTIPHFGADNHPDSDALSDFVAGEGTPQWRAAVETHLASCDVCREDVRTMRGTVALLHSLPQFAPPVSFQLGDEFARRTPNAGIASPSKIVRFLPVVRVLSVAAVLLFLVIGGVSVYEDRIQGDTAPPAEIVGAGVPTATSETDAPAAAFEDAEGETSSDEAPKNAAVAPSQSGVVDQGESASASGGNLERSAAQDSEATPPGDEVAQQAPASPESVDNDDDAGFPWLSTTIGFGALAVVLVGLWIALTRISRSR